MNSSGSSVNRKIDGFKDRQIVNESSTLNRLRTLSLTASASLSSVPWWRRPIQEVLNQLFQRPLPRKSVNVTPVPRRTARATPAPVPDRPSGRILGSETGGGGAVQVQKGARVLRENSAGAYGVNWQHPTAP
jgi:hypothetical protein